MRIPGKGDREQALADIAAVPPSATDPVYGRSGPLISSGYRRPALSAGRSDRRTKLRRSSVRLEKPTIAQIDWGKA